MEIDYDIYVKGNSVWMYSVDELQEFYLEKYPNCPTHFWQIEAIVDSPYYLAAAIELYVNFDIDITKHDMLKRFSWDEQIGMLYYMCKEKYPYIQDIINTQVDCGGFDIEEIWYYIHNKSFSVDYMMMNVYKYGVSKALVIAKYDYQYRQEGKLQTIIPEYTLINKDYWYLWSILRLLDQKLFTNLREFDYIYTRKTFPLLQQYCKMIYKLKELDFPIEYIYVLLEYWESEYNIKFSDEKSNDIYYSSDEYNLTPILPISLLLNMKFTITPVMRSCLDELIDNRELITLPILIMILCFDTDDSVRILYKKRQEYDTQEYVDCFFKHYRSMPVYPSVDELFMYYVKEKEYDNVCKR